MIEHFKDIKINVIIPVQVPRLFIILLCMFIFGQFIYIWGKMDKLENDIWFATNYASNVEGKLQNQIDSLAKRDLHGIKSTYNLK